MSGPQTLTRRRSSLRAAIEWLAAYLLAGTRPLAADVMADGMAAGHSARTLFRARRALGVVSQRVGYGPGAAYVLRLPDSPPPAEPPIESVQPAAAPAPLTSQLRNGTWTTRLPDGQWCSTNRDPDEGADEHWWRHCERARYEANSPLELIRPLPRSAS